MELSFTLPKLKLREFSNEPTQALGLPQLRQ